MTMWRHGQNLLTVRDGERLFVLARTGRVPVVLQGTSLAVWQAMDGHSVDDAVDVLARHYEVPSARIRDEVRACAAELARQGLLRLEGVGDDDDD